MRQTKDGFGIVLIKNSIVEVNMQAVPSKMEGAGPSCLSAYLAVLIDFDIKKDQAVLHLLNDPNQTLFVVSMKQIARPSYVQPLPEISPGDLIEVRCVIDPEDGEMGWWQAQLKSVAKNKKSAIVEWPDGETEKVHTSRLRKAVFVPYK